MNNRNFLDASSMSRRQAIQIGTALMGLLGPTQQRLAQAVVLNPRPPRTRPPNIILFLADDLGYGDLSCYGSRIYTPNIDRLANEGARLTQYRCSAPICTPSRASLLTGLEFPRTGLTDVLRVESEEGLGDFDTFAKLLRDEAGYNTGCIGKWHLGMKEQHSPLAHGFDYYEGTKVSNDMQPLHWYVGDQAGEDMFFKQGELMNMALERAQRFIKARAENREKFLLYLPLWTPHMPLMPVAPFAGMSGLGPYADMVLTLNAFVGQVLNLLAELGLDQDTWVGFTSDNGPVIGDPSKPGYSPGDYTEMNPLLGGKYGNKWGIRGPFLTRWAGKIRPGTVSNGLVGGVDIFSTLLSIGGVRSDHPAILSSDGKNIRGTMEERYPWTERDNLLLHFGGKILECAEGVFQDPADGEPKIFKVWFYEPGIGGAGILLTPRLYIPDEDPAEQKDLMFLYPERYRDLMLLMYQKAKTQLETIPNELAFNFL